jgi:hypothetical protein
MKRKRNKILSSKYRIHFISFFTISMTFCFQQVISRTNFERMIANPNGRVTEVVIFCFFFLSSSYFLQTIFEELRSLQSKLRKQRDEDRSTLKRLIDTCLDMANGRLYDRLLGTPYLLREIFMLSQASSRDILPDFEQLVRSTLSNQYHTLLRFFNPFLNDADVETLVTLVLKAMSLTVRIGHVVRCLHELSNLIRAFQSWKIHAEFSDVSDSDKDKFDTESMWRQHLSLACLLGTRRNYVKFRSSAKRIVFEFDPRFLVFEFAHDLILRRSQIAMIDRFQAVKKDQQSLVMQMIMVCHAVEMIIWVSQQCAGCGEDNSRRSTPRNDDLEWFRGCHTSRPASLIGIYSICLEVC